MPRARTWRREDGRSTASTGVGTCGQAEAVGGDGRADEHGHALVHAHDDDDDGHEDWYEDGRSTASDCSDKAARSHTASVPAPVLATQHACVSDPLHHPERSR